MDGKYINRQKKKQPTIEVNRSKVKQFQTHIPKNKEDTHVKGEWNVSDCVV